MVEFTHLLESDGFIYEVSGTVDVDKGMDGLVIGDIVEYVDPYGIGLGIKRYDIPMPLKENLTAKFKDEAKSLFQQREELLGK